MDNCTVRLHLYGEGDEGVIVQLPTTALSVGPEELTLEALATAGLVLSLQRFASSPRPARLHIEWAEGTTYEVSGRIDSWRVSASAGEELGRLWLSMRSGEPAGTREVDVTTLSDRERRTMSVSSDRLPPFDVEEPEGRTINYSEILRTPFALGARERVIIPERSARRRKRSPEVEEQRERVIRLDDSDPSGGGGGE